MNIKREIQDDLNSVINIQITPEDYNEKVDNILKDYRKKATIDGFRPGKAPFGMIKKMYGTSALLDQVNELLSDSLNNFIIENKLRILGEPIPSENAPAIDWENQDTFDFSFDIAVAPEVEMTLSKKDKVLNYIIEVDDKIIEEQIENFSQRFGEYAKADKSEENDLLKGDFIQLDENGEPVLDGLRTEDTLVSVNTITDKKMKKLFVGIEANQDIIVEPNLAFPNEADRAAMFKIKKDDLDKISGKFKFSVSEVSRFKAAEVNQELFDKTYGEGTVSSLEEYKEKIKKDIEMQLSNESSYKFHLDAREKLLSKGKFDLPDEFLKRWMLATTKDETLTREKIEEEYPGFKEDLRWQLIREKFVNEQEIKAEPQEIKSYAIQDARNRFRQYGMYDVPEDQLAGLAESILSNKEEERRLIEQILENKVINFVKETVKVEDKTISLDEFKKMFD